MYMCMHVCMYVCMEGVLTVVAVTAQHGLHRLIWLWTCICVCMYVQQVKEWCSSTEARLYGIPKYVLIGLGIQTCVYIYTYTCAYIHIYMCVCTCSKWRSYGEVQEPAYTAYLSMYWVSDLDIQIYVYIYTYTCVYVYTNDVCIHIYMYVCTCSKWRNDCEVQKRGYMAYLSMYWLI